MKLQAIEKALRHQVTKDLNQLESTIKRMYKPVQLELNLDHKKSILSFSCLLDYSRASADKHNKAILGLLVGFAKRFSFVLATNPMADLSGDYKRMLRAYGGAGFVRNQGKDKVVGIKLSHYQV